jgi:hypothetical protein
VSEINLEKVNSGKYYPLSPCPIDDSFPCHIGQGDCIVGSSKVRDLLNLSVVALGGVPLEFSRPLGTINLGVCHIPFVGGASYSSSSYGQ